MADRLISCDDHMDRSQLHADLWTARLPASLLDRAPHVEERDGSVVNSGGTDATAGDVRSDHYAVVAELRY